MSDNISIEPLLNRKQRTLGTKYVDQVVVEGPGGTTTNRAVTLVDNTATLDTPTADCSEIHYVNNTGATVRYGGTGVTATTGGLLYTGSTLAIKYPQTTFGIYFIQNSGGPLDLDVVEFF